MRRASVPASPRPIAIEPDAFFAHSPPWAALDTLEPSPTVLPSAEEAKARLREVIEGFFFRPRIGDPS